MTSKLPRIVAASVLLLSQLVAQDPVYIEKRQVPFIVRPYLPPTVPPPKLSNSNRIRGLIRAGKLYLTVQDAIALAIENNLSLEVDRYGPLLAQVGLTRAEAGGPLRGVPSGTQQISNVNTGLGVTGSTASAGLSGSGGNGGGGAGGAASIQQIGPVTQNLDPVVQSVMAFSHQTEPFANTVVSETTALIRTTHIYDTVLTQGLLSGGYVQYHANEQYLKENAPSDILNPAFDPIMDLYLQHNLLQGLGTGVNGRFIRVAKNNTGASLETFRSQLLDLVSNVLNLYWDVVSGRNDLQSRQHAVDIAQKFYEDTKTQIDIGTLASVELPRAQVEVASRQQDLIIAQANLRQQETLLKEAISRTPDPLVEEAEIVPLDRIEVPATDNLPPLRELVATALAKRPDIAVAKIREENAEINALGTENALLPTAQVFARLRNRGAAGTAQNPEEANPYFVGGYGTAMGQVFRRNFPSESGGAYIQIPVRNRQAQGDYGVDQLQLQQSRLSDRRDANQIVVDISNQATALRQARARYSQALATRKLQEELLSAEQQKFSFGVSTLTNIIVAQRSLVAAQAAEVASQSSYAHARVSLDQVLGETLEVNHVSLEEGLSGKVARQSEIPASTELRP